MPEFCKVSSLTYDQIAREFSAEHFMHSLNIGYEQIGYMDMVEQDEDRMYFEYFIREDYYNRYQLACV
jgi:hypothetical protein